jgi:hypothetical protein
MPSLPPSCAAEPLAPADRSAFLGGIAGLLQGQTIGDGAVARACGKAWQKFWTCRISRGRPARASGRARAPVDPLTHRLTFGEITSLVERPDQPFERLAGLATNPPGEERVMTIILNTT